MARYPTKYPTRERADKQAAKLRERYKAVLVFWAGSHWAISHSRAERKNAPPRKPRARKEKT